MRVAYEDVRFAPRGKLKTELLECSLEHELYYTTPPEGESSTSSNTTDDSDDIMDAEPMLVNDDTPTANSSSHWAYPYAYKHSPLQLHNYLASHPTFLCANPTLNGWRGEGYWIIRDT